ncbi:MAG: 16S rRNA (cytosine(967)-C(5))-methyltransferase RsmB [Rubrivivax sp.]|nr:16S rRNA (cytosine(967)-C(5))-methyltransferase RsmB [Rubrivivax sp.]
MARAPQAAPRQARRARRKTACRPWQRAPRVGPGIVRRRQRPAQRRPDRLPRVSPPVHSPSLALLLEHAADAVAAVRAGRSLTELLPRQPEALRPGVQALAFHALRRLGAAQAVRAQLAPKTPPPAVEALLLTALALLWPAEPDDPQGEPPYAEHTLVDQAVAAARRRVPAAAGFVNAVLRRFLRERAACVEAAGHSPLGAWNHPPWWIDRLRHDWPANWQGLLRQANRRPPMTLRANARRGSAEQLVERLARHGIAAQLLPPLTPALAAYANHAVWLHEPRPVTQLPGFVEGEVSVQDAAAQVAAPLVLGAAAAARPAPLAPWTAALGGAGMATAALPPLPPLSRLRPGARVLDACAAPGGKTAHLLELAPDIELVALDADAARLARVQENLARLHLAGSTSPPTGSVQVAAADARRTSQWWDGRPFDAILLDAPCTASGIVRRHPDVRWLRRPADIDALGRVQAELLDALWPLLAPGGRLLYATCSVFKAEGGQQIDAFLQRLGPGAARLHPHSPGHLLPLADNETAREPGAPATPAATGGASPPRSRPPPGAAHDGFFYALIEKT